MKDIKVTFTGAFSPSGKKTNVPYMVGKARLEQWEKNGKFEMDVEKPKASPKKEKPKKAKKEKK